MGEDVELERAPAVPLQPAAPASAERWPAEAWQRIVRELRHFFATALRFIRAPRVFAEDWAAGTRDVLNPLGFAATAAGIYWTVSSALAAMFPVTGADDGTTMFDQLAPAIGPYLHYGLLGVLMHAVLRLFGSRRALSMSIGTAFFAGGSIGTALSLTMLVASRWVSHARQSTGIAVASGDTVAQLMFAGAILGYCIFCALLARAMLGLHGGRGGRVVVALVVAVLVTALLFGNVVPDGAYGWHPQLGITVGDGGFSINGAFGE